MPSLVAHKPAFGGGSSSSSSSNNTSSSPTSSSSSSSSAVPRHRSSRLGVGLQGMLARRRGFGESGGAASTPHEVNSSHVSSAASSIVSSVPTTTDASAHSNLTTANFRYPSAAPRELESRQHGAGGRVHSQFLHDRRHHQQQQHHGGGSGGTTVSLGSNARSSESTLVKRLVGAVAAGRKHNTRHSHRAAQRPIDSNSSSTVGGGLNDSLPRSSFPTAAAAAASREHRDGGADALPVAAISGIHGTTSPFLSSSRKHRRDGSFAKEDSLEPLAETSKAQLLPLRDSRSVRADASPGRLRSRKMGLAAASAASSTFGVAGVPVAHESAASAKIATANRALEYFSSSSCTNGTAAAIRANSLYAAGSGANASASSKKLQSVLPRNIHDHHHHSHSRHLHSTHDLDGGHESDGSTTSHQSFTSNASHGADVAHRHLGTAASSLDRGSLKSLSRGHSQRRLAHVPGSTGDFSDGGGQLTDGELTDNSAGVRVQSNSGVVVGRGEGAGISLTSLPRRAPSLNFARSSSGVLVPELRRHALGTNSDYHGAAHQNTRRGRSKKAARDAAHVRQDGGTSDGEGTGRGPVSALGPRKESRQRLAMLRHHTPLPSSTSNVQSSAGTDAEEVGGSDGGSLSNPSLRGTPGPSGIQRGTTARPQGLVGLQNLGNTCFMNSCLQCVSNVDSLIEHVLGFEDEIDLNPNSFTKGQLALAYKRLLTVTRNAQAFTSTRPAAVKKAVGKLAKRFIGFKQQDAQEFLRFLLDGLHDDLNKVVTKPAYVELKDDPEQSDLEASNRWWDNYCCRNISCIKDLFCGQLRSEVVCQTCKSVSIAYDPFWDLSVSIPKRHQARGSGDGMSPGGAAGTSSRRRSSPKGGGRRKVKGKCSLYECLSQLTESEELSGDDAYYCSKCKQHQTSLKRMCIFRVPKVLVLHLKRFSYRAYRRTKLQTRVDFPLSGLDLYDYCWTSASQEVPADDRSRQQRASSPTQVPRQAFLAQHPACTSETGATNEDFATTLPPSARPMYDLVAVSNHMGDCGGGHYTADCFKKEDGRWYRFNDARVSEMAAEDLDGVSAYLLFYVLREPPSRPVQYHGSPKH